MKAYIFDNQPVCRMTQRAARFIGIRDSILTYFFLQGDQRLPHDSGKEVSVDALERLGVLYYNIADIAAVDKLAEERGYRNRDEIKVSPATMGDIYEAKVKSFFDEHLHEDEEIRYVRGGAGYFDVRDTSDEWVRIRLEKDDLIILPAGIYHRFTTDETNVSTRPPPRRLTD